MKTGAKGEGFFSRKKRAKWKDTASTSANKDGKVKDTEVLKTKTVVKG